MLEDLNHYENLGTPKFFYELFQQLSNHELKWTDNAIDEYFHNRIIDENTVFDGCVPMAKYIGAVIVDGSGFISLNSSLANTLVNENYLSNKLLEMIMVEVKNDEVFYEIFCPENISYDVIYKLIQIDIGAFPFRHSNFRKLLMNFGFLYPHPDTNIRKFIINSRYKKFFDRELLPGIKRRKIGIEELEKMLEQKQIYGREAESFVLKYEKMRVSTHPNLNCIEIISDYDVSAGYDVISYATANSVNNDRFIEVKSYAGNPSFHWSKNEIEVARIKKDSYFIYLVDREKMMNETYEPVTIQDPYEKLIINPIGWDKKIEGYFITKNIDE